MSKFKLKPIQHEIIVLFNNGQKITVTTSEGFHKAESLLDDMTKSLQKWHDNTAPENEK